MTFYKCICLSIIGSFPILLLSTTCAKITRAIFNYEEHILIDYCITTIQKTIKISFQVLNFSLMTITPLMALTILFHFIIL
jgi:hypothetical protein